MIIVSDASPIHYLVLTDTVDLLPVLYGVVLIPEAVQYELTRQTTPEKVRAWMADLPNWFTVRSTVMTKHVELLDPSGLLDAGEREAIALALELDAPLLIDERIGRRFASENGVKITGLLGMLEAASIRGLIKLSDIMEKLQGTNFYVRQEIVEAMLARERLRDNASIS